MTAQCDSCGNDVERVWSKQSDERTKWLCEACHPDMT
jgi:hypothetical protein